MFLLLAVRVNGWLIAAAYGAWHPHSDIHHDERRPKTNPNAEKNNHRSCVLLLLLKMLLRNIEHSRRPKCFFFPLDVSLDGPPPPSSSTPTCQFGSVRWRPLDAFTRNNTRVMGCARSASPLAQMIDPRTPTFDRFSVETPLRATAPPVVF